MLTHYLISTHTNIIPLPLPLPLAPINPHIHTSTHYNYSADIEAGDIIGSGGFSNIIEVKNIRGSSESLETAGTVPTYISHPNHRQNHAHSHSQSQIDGYSHSQAHGQTTKGHHRNSSWSSDCSQQSQVSLALKQARTDIPGKEAKACARIDLAVEAQFLQTLSHPNIVSLHGLGEEPGNKDFFIIIERIDRTLGREIYYWRSHLSSIQALPKREGKKELKLFMEDRIGLALQLTCALKYLHSKK
jgi:serine/threonine protein kinase